MERYIIDHIDQLTDEKAASLQQELEAKKLVIIKGVISKDYIDQIKTYLTHIGQHSFPQFHPIEESCPNSHRITDFDPRSFVQGCFHQFSFFPWNQDHLGLFSKFQRVYEIKNILAGLPKSYFTNMKPDMGCTSRLSFQFYPAGKGALNRHIDPVDKHQLVVPTLTMSKKGDDYKEGGLYVELDGEKVYIDDVTDVGDVILFNAQMVHGVDPVDPDAIPNWMDFIGRWTMVFAVNKLASNTEIINSQDLEKS